MTENCAVNDCHKRELLAALKRIDYYYDLNDCDEMSPADAIEIDVKALREIHELLKDLS